VSDLVDDLEEVADQASVRVNHPTRRVKSAWGISPNIEHTHVTREPKGAPARGAAVEAAVEPAAASKRSSANLGRLVTDYRTLVETCRARADELELSRLEIDRLGGLPVGYAGKLLGKDGGEPGRKHKKMWPIALESMLGVLGLKILLIEDEAATARTLALRTPVDRANQRFGNVSRLTPKLLEPPTAPPSRPALSIVNGSQKRGGKYG
jgi:hypothetical protein